LRNGEWGERAKRRRGETAKQPLHASAPDDRKNT
jgi:hypothetical protein